MAWWFVVPKTGGQAFRTSVGDLANSWMCGKELFPLLSPEDHNTQPVRSHYELAILSIKCLLHIRRSKYIYIYCRTWRNYMAGEQLGFFFTPKASILLRWSKDAKGSLVVSDLGSAKAPVPRCPQPQRALANSMARTKHTWATEWIKLRWPPYSSQNTWTNCFFARMTRGLKYLWSFSDISRGTGLREEETQVTPRGSSSS